MTADACLMVLFYVASAAYATVAIVFADLTLREGIEKQLPWNTPRLLGILSSAAWPAILILAVYEARFAAKRRSSIL